MTIEDQRGVVRNAQPAVGGRAPQKLSSRTTTAPEIAYRVFGDSGPPVLFIMGFGMPGGVWGPQVRELGREYRCCHYDHLGLGDSEPGSPFPSMPSMAADAIRVLDDLGWDRAHIVGVSMGGMIAQELVLRDPDRCATLALIATHGGGRGALVPTPQGAMLFARGVLGGPKARMKTMPRLLYPEPYLRGIDRKAFKAHMRERLGRPTPGRTMVGQLLAIWRHRTERRLNQIERPTLLVRPALDILVPPSQTDRLARRIESAEVVEFDDAGHGVTFQKSHELNRALRRHFAKVAL